MSQQGKAAGQQAVSHATQPQAVISTFNTPGQQNRTSLIQTSLA